MGVPSDVLVRFDPEKTEDLNSSGFWLNLSGSSPSPIKTQPFKSSQGYEDLDCLMGPMGQLTAL